MFIESILLSFYKADHRYS